MHESLKTLLTTTLLTLTAMTLAVSAPLRADDGTTHTDPAAATAPDEVKYQLDLESSSHVVRREEDRLNFRYRAGEWDFEGLLSSFNPRFRDDRDQLGLAASRAFGAAEVTAVARLTDKPEGQDVVGGVRFRRAAARGVYGAEVTFGQADLAIDDFLVGDGEGQLAGELFWRREKGFEIAVFAAASATFDLMRGTGELLARLPRSAIAGAETLADLYVDEARLEDSAGVKVGFRGAHWQARAYLKGGEQTIRGVLAADDFTGFGGEFRFAATSWSLDAELDLRQIEPADGFDSFNRGRLLVDFRHRPGRLEWGAGAYVQGEAETFNDIASVYDTAGVGFTAAWRRARGNRIGFWAMWEDNAPDLQVISRLAVFRRTARREYGAGVRRDEVGLPRFTDATVGPFVFVKTPFRNLIFDGSLGVQDGEVYGRISLAVTR